MTELRLRAADSTEWSYFVTMPDLPADQVEVGDQLDLSVISGPQFIDLAVVLGQGSALVLFSVVSWLWQPPELSDYSIDVTLGKPYCVNPSSYCGTHYPLLVTSGTNSAQLQPGETKLLGDLSVSVEALRSGTPGSPGHCDPPTDYRYGGFSLRR